MPVTLFYRLSLSLFYLFLFTECGSEVSNSGKAILTQQADSLYRTIEVNAAIQVNWDMTTQKIRKDALFEKFRLSYPQHRIALVQAVEDTTSLRIQTCAKQQVLRRGDVAFMLVDAMEELPLFVLLNVQFDVYDIDCPYAYGLYDYVENNRPMVKEKLVQFMTATHTRKQK